MDVLPSETLAEYIERARAEQSAHFDAEIARLEAMPDDAPEFQGTIWTKGARIAQMRQRDRSAESLLDVRSYEREWHRVNAERADPLLQCEQGDAAFAKLMAAPVSAPRKRIRKARVEVAESIDTRGKSLADIIRGRGKPYRSILSKQLPTYEQWLRRFTTPDEAEREAGSARQEWADRKAGLYSRECTRRRKQLARKIPAPVETPYAAVGPLRDFVRLPRVAKSRSSWPSYREQSIAALIAAREWEYLADIGFAEVIDLAPMPVETIEAPEYAEAA
jgi:hypothetical protein